MPWVSPPIEAYNRLRWDNGPILPQSKEGIRRPRPGGDWEFVPEVWQTQHGDAIVTKEGGGAYQVRGALMPNGRRVDCRRSRDAGPYLSTRWRLRRDDEKGWQPGHLTLSDQDVTFVDADPPHYFPKPNDPPGVLERTLSSNARVLDLLQDDWFAQGASDWLGAKDTCSVDGDIPHFESGRSVADIIASLRGLGEIYLDFYAGLFVPPMRYDSVQITEELLAAGVRVMSREEWARAEREMFGDGNSS